MTGEKTFGLVLLLLLLLTRASQLFKKNRQTEELLWEKVPLN